MTPRRATGALALAAAAALSARPATAQPAAATTGAGAPAATTGAGAPAATPKPGAPPASELDPPAATYDVGPEGRRFRVTFDPASRVWIGVAGGVARGASAQLGAALEVNAGLGFRNRSATGDGKDRVSWEIDHRVLAGWVRPLPRPDGYPAFDGSLYDVTMLRHDASPSIVLPTSPPVGIPFPFDIGLNAQVGRFTTLAYPDLHAVRLGVARAAIVLDPWRSGAPGRSFAIGLGARYDIDAVVRGPSTPIVHRVAPMTAGSVRFRYQSRDGLAVVDCQGEVVPHFASDGGWKVLALSSVHVERALIALADQPIAAVLDGGYRFDPPRHDAEGVSDFRVTLGLAVNLMLR